VGFDGDRGSRNDDLRGSVVDSVVFCNLFFCRPSGRFAVSISSPMHPHSRIERVSPSPLPLLMESELVLEASSREDAGDSRRREYEFAAALFREVDEWLEW